MADVYQALKKVILIEEKLSVMAEDVAKLSDKMVEIDRRLLKLETKLEVYEGIAKEGNKLIRRSRKIKKMREV